MNRNLSTLLLSLLVFPLLTSCGQDRWPEYAEQTHLDRWIDSVMRENYLWYASMPSDKELNYFVAPDQFLKSVTDASQDNGYTRIDTLMEVPEPTYGFDYTLYRNAKVDTIYEALITYVLPSSPAERAGLQRGQWIVAVNDSSITKNNETALLGSGKSLKLTLGRYEIQTEEEQQSGSVQPTGYATLEAAASVEDNPINHYSILETGNGKAGYLVYSHFTAGTEQEPEKYNNRLREIFQEFAAAGIQHLILDLRYNKGGELATGQLLASLAAPGSLLGSPFATLKYNDKQTQHNRTLTYDPSLTGHMQPLEIRQGIIIASSTTGGVSGTLLNCLAPQSKWALVGSEVKCPGVATEPFIYPLRTWSLNLVTCTVSNQLGETGANGTFVPNAPCSETSDLTRFRNFGDPEEQMLGTAISLIEGTYQPDDGTATRQSPEPVKTVNASRTHFRHSGVRL